MAVVISIMKGYFIAVVAVMLVYMLRHLIFSYNRQFARQKISYRDIYDSDLPFVTVLIPMHNEEAVLRYVIESLLRCDYDPDKLEIIAINDHSEDATQRMLNRYFSQYPFVRPLHREGGGERGKPVSLNEAMRVARGEIIVVFDADYRPSQNLLKKLASAFLDPQVGAVMGRVAPVNANVNVLTNLLNLERSGGYQVDQQARYNLNLIPQYGGTVGGFRKEPFLAFGGFNTSILAEDTELTYKLYVNGWRIVYDNSAECYEESPETWAVRGRQIRRWARGHNAVMWRYFGRVLTSRFLNLWEKLDGLLLLLVYAVPFLLGVALIDCLGLFFLGEMDLFYGWWVILFIGIYNAWGNFAPFFEVSVGAILDGMGNEIMLLPMLCFSFYFYMWNISLGFLDSLVDLISGRSVKWNKTQRFAGRKREPAAEIRTDGKQAPA